MKKTIKARWTSLSLFAYIIFLAGAPMVYADEVEDYMKSARNLYEAKKYSEAITELQFAISKIQDLQAGGYQAVLPDPPSGWTATETATSKMAGMFMGGGVVLTRSYSNDKGETIDITVMSDSPAINSIVMMTSNPMFLGGNKLVKIKRHKAIEEWDAQSGSGNLSVIVEDRCLVTIDGSGLTSKETLYRFANLVNYDKIKKLIDKK